MATYTSGDWHVNPGREKEFVDLWREMAEWSGREFDSGGWAKLLRDRENPTYFRSVAKWADEQTIERWRTSEGFKERLAKVRELVDDVHIYTLDVAAEVEA